MTTEATNMETKATPEITRAAERYLEQYGDPLVMNTYLKVTILVLAAQNSVVNVGNGAVSDVRIYPVNQDALPLINCSSSDRFTFACAETFKPDRRLILERDTLVLRFLYDRVEVFNRVGSAFADDFTGTPFALRLRKSSDSRNRTNPRSLDVLPCSRTKLSMICADLPPTSDHLRIRQLSAASSPVRAGDLPGQISTRWNERESTWRKHGSCPSRGTNQSKS